MSVSQPTTLNPWYVVFDEITLDGGTLQTAYFADEGWETDDAQPIFSPLKKKARIFMSLSSACRVAQALGADVLILWSGEKAREFRR